MKLLVVVDYQNDFVTGALANPFAEPLESKIAKFCNSFLNEGGKVIFTRDTHEKDFLQTREGTFLPVPHCMRGSDGWQLTNGLLPLASHASSRYVDKPTFGSADLAQKALELCGEEPSEIHICGVVTDICVVSNAILLHSAFLNAQCFMHEGLCAAITGEGHSRAVELLRGLGWKIV